MTICSMVVHTRPEKIEAVRHAITEHDGVEVHAVSEEGKMVVTIDHPDYTYCSERVMQMNNVDGVLSAALIYEYHDDDDEADSNHKSNQEVS